MRQYSLAFDAGAAQPAPALQAAQILQGLNERQQEAVVAVDGPVMIVAGPGSGKTRTLTHRIAYLLATGKARPYQILALTFTNKAAREMKARVEKLVGSENAGGMWMGTFHSTFARMLRVEAEALGYTRDFSIYDTEDAERTIRDLMGGLAIDTRQFSPRSMLFLLSSAKNHMVGPEEYRRTATTHTQELASRIYGPYNETLKRANAMDFDDLLVKPIELFQQRPDLLEKYQGRWTYIHIDEYQDTNRAQYVLTKTLADRHKNLCVVGDDAQSIYAFRGADIGNILSFQRDYPNATTIRLEQSYRSSKRILRLADSIIGHNRDQLEKTLWTENAEGTPIVLMEAVSEKDEAQKIERRIRDLGVRAGYRFTDFAVLYRTNAQSRSLEDALRRGSIPYRVVGGMSFYQRREIKDVLAYLRLLVNPNDAVSLRRVINYPVRGIGTKTQDDLYAFADREGISMWQALERLEESGLSSRTQTLVAKFRDLVKPYMAQVHTRPADQLARELIKESGILADLRDEGTQEGLVRWENVQELVNAIAEFATLGGERATLSEFLQQVSLFTDQDTNDRDEERVTLMTLHASKGLEFEVVFVAGLEEGLFPLANATQERKELEEERRLFYVGTTRAKAHLFLSFARSRFRYGEHQSSVRSRFLEEIDPTVLLTEAGETVEQRPGRYQAPQRPAVAYDQLDPHYYRQSLSVPKPAASAKPAGRRVVYDESEGGRIVPGVLVEHDQFGEGKVLSLEGVGDQARAVVFFPDVGQKKLVLKFAKLRLVE
jgi:DNA helicase-2/ATP-dependent DNA helicase PcrA